MREEVDSKFGEKLKHYSVGDMAKMLSLSPSSIRFYDQEGIVVPNRAEENTYREYSVVDGNYLLKVKELKNIGLPIPQIKEMLNHFTLEEFESGLAEAEASLRRSLSQIESFHSGVCNYIKRCELCSKVGIIDLQPRPAMYRFSHQINDVFLEGEGQIETLKKWTDLLPLTVLSFKFLWSELQDNPYTADLNWGFSIDADEEAARILSDGDLTEWIPAANAIHMVFCTSNSVFLQPQFLSPALAFASKHNFDISGDIIGNSLARVIGNSGEVLHYYEVWLPIKIDA